MATCQEIIDRARQLADVNGSQFFSSAEEFASLNESYRDLYEQICEANDDYFTTDWVFQFADLVQDPDIVTLFTIDLPATFYRLRSLRTRVGSRWATVYKATVFGSSRTVGYAQYRLKGTKLELDLPIGASFSTFRAVYYPIPTAYSSTAQSITFPPQLEPGILSYQIAIDIRRKQNGEYAGLQQRRDELWNRFTNAIRKRDDAQYETVANVYGGANPDRW